MQQAFPTPAPVVLSTPAARHESVGRWFFVGLASVVVATVAVGFAPSLYLRGLGTEGLPPTLQTLPVYAYLHGIALTGWFLLFFAQTLLVASGRTRIHRRLGVAAVIFGLGVIVTTLVMVQHSFYEPLRGSFRDVPVAFFGTVGSVVQFAVLLGAALYFRGRPETHKRLMVLANVPLMGAALSRLPGVFEHPSIIIGAPLILLLALIVRDLTLNRRLHPATIWGGIVFVMVVSALIGMFGQSSLANDIVQAL
jgi:hypothetical protein